MTKQTRLVACLILSGLLAGCANHDELTRRVDLAEKNIRVLASNAKGADADLHQLTELVGSQGRALNRIDDGLGRLATSLGGQGQFASAAEVRRLRDDLSTLRNDLARTQEVTSRIVFKDMPGSDVSAVLAKPR